MKNILFLFSVIILCSCSNSSPSKEVPTKEIFWPYYEQCLSARDSFLNENYVHASILFEAAINSVENPNWADVNKAIQTELFLGNHAKVKDYSFLLAKKHGLFPKEKHFAEATNISYEKLKAELSPILEQTKLSFNIEYIRLIDSLMKIDQGLRMQNKPNFNIPINFDSLNTHCLLKIIDRFGFPSADKVGIEHYRLANVILTHADFDIENVLLGDVMYKAMEQGKMRPHEYAEIIDRRCNYNGKTLEYFELPFEYEKLDQNEKNEVTIRRRKIGLGSVENSIKVVTLPSGDLRVSTIN